jgi:crotonobetainyl-CoA:carnitine CoA-transferase CaiB-like acyl-CoA transferase
MVRLISEAIRQKHAAEWLEQLEAAGIPAGPINSITQALSDVQAQHRQMVRTVAGVPLVGSPVRLDGGRAGSDLPPPALGEHTDELLASIAIDADQADWLRANRIIA